ncbi:hypothetical protein D6C89_10468 [Aureobasidium pullulans]|nr:hypothetical protein D6C89_10468 [Aureobasidium pullulans]
MSEWLLRAWGTSPVTHYVYNVPLLALGYSAALGHVDKYEKQRAMCTERFVSWRAKSDASVNPSTKKSLCNTLSCETRNLIPWMLAVDPLADNDEFDRRYTLLLRSKALIVVQAYSRYGQKAWKSRVDVAKNMLGQATPILERDV